jgi:glycosyltransferase involved in cell wall biosynthesis
LAYSYFLAETHTLLPFYNKHGINFVFVLYPGGAFGLNNKGSDEMLKEIFASKYFKKVITTKNVTYDYLISKGLCPTEKIVQMKGILQITPEQALPHEYFSIDKKNLDICFVAHKYSERGEDKGYDLFIDTAKILSKKADNIMFHVIGDFNKHDINIEGLEGRIIFYGLKRPDFLLDFYSKMDIFLSPNRPYRLYEGNFDGFPLGGDSSICGTALFATDELNQNVYLEEGKEFVKIQPNIKDIVKKIYHYYEKPSELIKLARRGQQKMQYEFDLDEQLKDRVNLFHDLQNGDE